MPPRNRIAHSHHYNIVPLCHIYSAPGVTQQLLPLDRGFGAQSIHRDFDQRVDHPFETAAYGVVLRDFAGDVEGASDVDHDR